MRPLSIFILIAVMSVGSVWGQTLDRYTGIEGCYKFYVYIPPTDTLKFTEAFSTRQCLEQVRPPLTTRDSSVVNQKKPLIIFLHGHSLCGNNLERVRTYGPLHAIQMGRKIDALVLAPQNPGGAWIPSKINKTLEWVEAHYPIDTNRIYVFGMSLGGYGTFDFVGTYPEKIAAAIAMCGGSQLRDFCGLNEVPLWIIHGTADRDVPISQSTRIINAMKKCGDTERLIFSSLKGVSHGGLARAFYLSSPYEWLLSHRLDMPGRPVTPGYTFTPSDLNAAYNDLRNGGVKIKVRNKDDNQGNERSTTKEETTESTKPQYHKVKKGETLERIAKHNHTTISRLCELNKMKRDDVLREGKRIRIK